MPDWNRAPPRSAALLLMKAHVEEFLPAITSKLGEMSEDLQHENGRGRADVKFHRGSCLDLLPSMPTGSIGGIITSPPYCNRYDYTRTYALELAMLGFDDEAVKNLRQEMLSATVENRPKKDRKLARVPKAGTGRRLLGLILGSLEEARQRGDLNNPAIPGMVRNYFRELEFVIRQCHRVLMTGAPMVMVNDCVRYAGVTIPVDLILSDMARQAGFSVEAIWTLPRGKGNSSQQMGLHGRQELRKGVYVWRKTRKS